MRSIATNAIALVAVRVANGKRFKRVVEILYNSSKPIDKRRP